MDNRPATPTAPRDTVAFRETVPTAFSFLTAEHGFTLTQENECLFTARSKDCLVRIYLEWGDVAVTLQPIEAHQAPGARTPPRELGLAIIMARLFPKVEWAGGLVTKSEELIARIHQMASLLQTHCSRLLRGDYSDWSRLEAYADELTASWREQQEQLVTDTKLRDVRTRAESAFRARDYGVAVSLYESIRETLTPAERAKVAYARRQLGYPSG